MSMKLIQGDCLPAMKEMPDNAYDLAIVDPPYGIGEDGGKQVEWKSRPNSIGKEPKYKKKFWDNARPREEYFTQLFRVSTNQIIWGGNYFSEYLKSTGKWIVWDKLIEIKRFTSCELAWTSFGGNTIRRFRIHPFHNLKGGQFKQHPTQKPVALYKWLLTNYAKPGQTILDTHLGSGSIAIACHDYGYDLTAYEIDKEYFEAATERIERHKAQGQLFQAGEVMTAESIKGRVGN